ncbi:PLP-dependent aminotransferase family protein [Picrophilus oshimae]|uniref:Transcriptional regulator, GntR family / aminotransferase class-I n=1 Tax=Picrophilus torridus (strain ATCC 700027 / DSM 9790 / JCM 10055 / NBRC 100828 / KAW 2/3) TaxID=1122961 RepID=Q6L1Q8_PICTO|nr:PLP-dependent aminotransferase family protein [Picrophilus oshimae]AAT43094.1 transcriptional regulator, GntR family / aminotransferase class-I [Picrophilus oshimae DSM 9789]
MKYEFSDNLKYMKSSAIRNLLKYIQQPGMISFGGGMPNPETFPIDKIMEITNDVLKNYGKSALQYGTTDGLKLLRDELVKFILKDENIKCGPENIFITTGSQQALYALSKIFANPGDKVILEAPTYVGMISSLNANAVDSESIGMDENGMIVENLEEKIKSMIKDGKKPRFIYTIPTFQNPAGYTMPLDRRKHLIEISKKYEIPVIEDNPYGDLRYSGSKVPTLKSLDDDVIYLGTFSKVMAPGLRTGYVIASEDVASKLNLLKQALDLAGDSFSQYIAYEYLKNGIIYEQIPKTIELYKRKRNVMLEALDEHVDNAEWSKPDGGMFLWLRIKKNVDSEKLLEKAIEKKVAYVPGSAFYHKNPELNTMRLNFTYADDDDIKDGIKRLGQVIAEA